MVKSKTGILNLLYQLLLLLLPLGQLGHDLPDGGDGESVGFGHVGIFLPTPAQYVGLEESSW